MRLNGSVTTCAPRGKEATPTLLQLLDVPLSPTAERRVVEVLGDMRAPEAAAGFAKHATSEDAGVRLAAIKGLSNLGTKANALDSRITSFGFSRNQAQATATATKGAVA